MKFKGCLGNEKVLLDKQKKRLFYHISLLLQKIHIFLPQSPLLYVSNLLIRQCSKKFKTSLIILFMVVIFFMIISYPHDSVKLIENNKNYPNKKVQYDSQPFVTPQNYKNDITFYEFKHKYNKKYTTTNQEIFRSIVYYRNLNKIQSHNLLQKKTYTMQINKFADLTPQQFASIYTTLYQSDKLIKNIAQDIASHQISFSNYQVDQNNMISEKDKLYVVSEVQRQIYQKYENSVRDNPEFISLNQILSNRKNPIFKDRISRTQGLRQSLSSEPANTLLSNVNDTFTQVDVNFTLDVIDWTVHSGQIRYQGICGACYTFATSDAVASLYSIYKFGFFIPLSTQQVIDCSTNGLTYGCNGGFLQGSFAYMQIRGIQTDYLYPYTSSIDETSKECATIGGPFRVASFRNIDEGDCKDLVNTLNYGPVSIGIAGYRLQFYSDGIFNDCNSYIDHAVVLIGYKSGVGWKIKNSWGTDWGMDGFSWIQDGNNCGICNMAVAA